MQNVTQVPRFPFPLLQPMYLGEMSSRRNIRVLKCRGIVAKDLPHRLLLNGPQGLLSNGLRKPRRERSKILNVAKEGVEIFVAHSPAKRAVSTTIATDTVAQVLIEIIFRLEYLRDNLLQRGYRCEAIKSRVSRTVTQKRSQRK